MRALNLVFLSLISLSVFAQEGGNPAVSEEKTVIGGYGQIDLNAALDDEFTHNAGLDVHRIVLFFGHRFSDKVSLVTEVEVEHVKEVYIEQAYLDYRVNSWLTFRGGLVLIPMGIINLYHESATFHSVERPLIDHNIAPSTWREIGAGFTGKFLEQGLSYQLYVVNGFKSYDGAGLIGGGSGLRGGRQKGAESIMRYPNIAFRTEYFGLSGLELGLSLYSGKTQSSLYDGIPDEEMYQALADSSVVGIFMLGFDARYQTGPWQFRAQLYNTALNNTMEYNSLSGRELGSSMYGYYIEAAYDILSLCKQPIGSLYPYLRYSVYDTHASTEGFDANPANEVTAITTGLSFSPAKGSAFKFGYHWVKDGNDVKTNLIQAGVAFNF